MNDRDLLVDSILKEISANRGVPYDKRSHSGRSGAEELVDEILAESALPLYTKPEETDVVSETDVKAVQSQETKMVSSKKEKNVSKHKQKKQQPQEDPLAAITPWAQRHKASGEQDLSNPPKETSAASLAQMTGVKKAESFFHSLKKAEQPAKAKAQLLYKNGGSTHPTAPVPPVTAAPMQEVSGQKLKQTVEEVSKRAEQTYEPTRTVTRVGRTVSTEAAKAATVHFSPVVHVKPDEITGQVRLEGFDDTHESAADPGWEEFVTNRQHKVRAFKMQTPEQPEEALPLTVEEDGEYHTPKDAEVLKYDLLARRRSITMRLWITFVLLAAAFLLTFVDVVDVTNGLLSDNPLLLLGLYLGVLLCAVCVNARLLWDGLTAVFTGGGSDTPAAIGMAAALVQGGVMTALGTGFDGAGRSLALIGCSALFCLLLNLSGRRLSFTRMYRNLELIGNDRIKYAVSTVENREEAFELGRGLAVGSPSVAYSRKAVHLQQFMYHSYAPDQSESAGRLPALLLPVFGLIGGLFAYFFTEHAAGGGQTITQVLAGICGGICAALPVTVLLAGNMPINRFQKKLYQRHIMLSGYDAAEEFCNTDVLTLDASQLFPAGTITLKSIKSASNQSLDRSIMDVAGVVYMADCPLKSLFEAIIQGKTQLLPEVDTLVYEEEMGISGWVMGYRVLVGTRSLMENHGIVIPDTNYEAQYQEQGLKAVYLSTQGILSAIFLVQYQADPAVAQGLQQAVAAGLGLHIYSCDPNITREMVCRMFRLPAASVRIMGAVPRRLYKQQQENEDAAQAILSYEGDAGDLCRSVTGAMKLHKVIGFAAALQTIFVLIGILLFLAGLYVLGTTALNGLWILLYQVIAVLLTVILPMLLGR